MWKTPNPKKAGLRVFAGTLILAVQLSAALGIVNGPCTTAFSWLSWIASFDAADNGMTSKASTLCCSIKLSDWLTALLGETPMPCGLAAAQPSLVEKRLWSCTPERISCCRTPRLDDVCPKQIYPLPVAHRTVCIYWHKDQLGYPSRKHLALLIKHPLESSLPRDNVPKYTEHVLRYRVSMGSRYDRPVRVRS
jgi:hypothetical protein